MGKQTMGTPVQSFPYRMDHKMYRLQTPQAPIVRTSTYDFYGIDDYPLGTNAIVAVISYTVRHATNDIVCVCVYMVLNFQKAYKIVVGISTVFRKYLC